MDIIVVVVATDGGGGYDVVVMMMVIMMVIMVMMMMMMMLVSHDRQYLVVVDMTVTQFPCGFLPPASCGNILELIRVQKKNSGKYAKAYKNTYLLLNLHCDDVRFRKQSENMKNC